MGDITNAGRAEAAMKSVALYASDSGLDINSELDDAISDLLANILHLCDQSHLDFDDLLYRSKLNHDAEVDEEEAIHAWVDEHHANGEPDLKSHGDPALETQEPAALQNGVTVFMIAERSTGDVMELLAYNVEAAPDGWRHFEVASERAVNDGYEVIRRFGSNDLLARQILGQSRLYASDYQYLSEVPGCAASPANESGQDAEVVATGAPRM